MDPNDKELWKELGEIKGRIGGCEANIGNLHRMCKTLNFSQVNLQKYVESRMRWSLGLLCSVLIGVLSIIGVVII